MYFKPLCFRAAALRVLRTAMAHNAPRDPAYLAHTEEGSLETSLVAAGAVDYAVVGPEPDRPRGSGGG